MNHTATIANVFNERILVIPDYQRGYAWEIRQWDDFLDDLDMLPEGREHYTGTLVLHGQPQLDRMDESGNVHRVYHVVDGQQRLTTIVIFLDLLRRELAEHSDRQALAANIGNSYVRTVDENGSPLMKLQLNQDALAFWEEVIVADQPGVQAPTIRSHERLLDARAHFQRALDHRRESGVAGYADWLYDSFKKVSQRLKFMVYEVGSASEVGVVFETMNNRGKPLSELEKVKNYLLYISDRLDLNHHGLAARVNDTWSTILTALMNAGMVRARDEDQLLRTHWLMAYDPDARHWEGSRSIKERFDLRHYRDPHMPRDKTLLKEVRHYLDTLKQVTEAFCDASDPTHSDAFGAFVGTPEMRREIRHWSERIGRIGISAPLLPLLVATRITHATSPEAYLDLIKQLERFTFRTFKIAGKRSNVGESAFYSLAYRLFHGRSDLGDVRKRMDALTRAYCNDARYERRWRWDPEDHDWYHWSGLKYLLYEYEGHLAGKRDIRLPWSQVAGRSLQLTIEHILPQTPSRRYWTTRFHKDVREALTHDLGNLSLTEDNSAYGNKAFPDKRGQPGQNGACYIRSKLFMEQDLARWEEWTPDAVAERREEIFEWARDRWRLPASCDEMPEDVGDDTTSRNYSRGKKRLMENAREALCQRLDDLVERGSLSQDGAYSVFAGRAMVLEFQLTGAGRVSLDVFFQAVGDGRPEITVRFMLRRDVHWYRRANAIRSYGDEVLEVLRNTMGECRYEAHGQSGLPHWHLTDAEGRTADGWDDAAIANTCEKIVRALLRVMPLRAHSSVDRDSDDLV